MAAEAMAQREAETTGTEALPSLELPTTYAELATVMNLLSSHPGYAKHRNGLAANNEDPTFGELREHEIGLSFWAVKHKPEEELDDVDTMHVQSVFQIMKVPGFTVKGSSRHARFGLRSLLGRTAE